MIMSGGMPSRGVAAALALVLLVAVAFAGVAGNGFVNFDDDVYITANAQVRRGLTPATALWALTSTEEGNWYPLRRLSHLADVSLFGLNPRGHHLASLAWHAAAVVLLFAALRLLTGAAGPAFVVAALFGAHPLQVESVAWAAERSNVLAGFFFALTLLLWARHARRPGPGRYGAALAAGALGLAAKPALVTLPFVLLLLDAWPLARLGAPGSPPWRPAPARLRRCLLEQAPLLLLAAAAGAMAVAAHIRGGGLSRLEAFPLGPRLANAVLSCGRYVAALLWPHDLAVFYPHPGRAVPLGAAALAGLLLLALTAVTLAQARRRPWLAVGWLWFLVMLAPVSGIVQFGSHARADRFVYLPAIGAFLALVWLAVHTLRPWRPGRAALAPLAGASLAALAAATAAQVGHWRDSASLFSHALRVAAPSRVSLNNLANALLAEGRPGEAEPLYRQAIQVRDDAILHANLGTALLQLGRREEALESYRAALARDPRLDFVRQRLAEIAGSHPPGEGRGSRP
jgi:tetratricopeptide (TPR) repeat protein